MVNHAIPSVAAVTLGALQFGGALVGVRTAKEPSYRVVLEDGDKQIREYSGYILASTRVDGDFEETSNIAFRRLFDFISGANTKEDKIAMTAPVLTARSGEKIAMTAPVLREKTDSGWTMSFVMPAGYALQDMPRPTNPLVELTEVPGYTAAVKRFSGTSSEEKFNRISDEVSDWLRVQGFRATSEPRLARYDPPFTVPFLRRNEVHIQVTH